MIKVYPSVLNGTIKAPASAEYAMRLLFASSIPSKATTIKNVPDCGAIDTAIDCLISLGCRIQKTKDENGRYTVIVEPFVKTRPLQELNFNFKDCAPTAYFVTAIAAAFAIKAHCRAEGTLPRRQHISFTGRLALRGITFSGFSYPFSMSGKLSPGYFEFRGDEGAQYISALLMVLPVLSDDSYIKVIKPYTERSLIDITLDILRKFNINVEEKEDGFFIPGKQYYDSPGELTCENAWSLATLWTSAGAACEHKGGRIAVSGLERDSYQAYRTTREVYPLICQSFEDLNINAEEFPELASYFAALAVSKGAMIRVDGVPQLKEKETNRLRAIGLCFERYGVEYGSDDSSFWIRGIKDKAYPENMLIDTMGDPWVFMSIVLASVSFNVPITLTNEHEAEKIYREFLDDFKALGGKFEIID